jgi:endonuclease/exonuclease/phosphatase family metal-dependent hydrolase
VCEEPWCDRKSLFNGEVSSHVRIFTHAQLFHRRSGTSIHVINTHFPLMLREQKVCTDLIQQYVRESIDPRSSLVLMGDFNSHYSPGSIESPLHQNFFQKEGLLDSLQFVDVPTFTEGFRLPLDTSKHRLDYIFYRSLRLEDSYVHNATYRGVDGIMYRPSDHEAVVAKFSFEQISR